MAGPGGWTALRVLWEFGRPHTLLGTSITVGALFAVTLGLDALPVAEAWVQLGLVGLAAICANVYVVGLNQLHDLAIDRINKPTLPLPAARLRHGTARQIVGLAAVASLVLAGVAGRWMLATVVAGLLVGTGYSVAPVRFKRHPALAAAAIASVRGPILNLGVGLHFITAVGRSSQVPTSAVPPDPWFLDHLGAGGFLDLAVGNLLGLATTIPGPVWLLAVVTTLYSLGIAVAKDIPDVEGDTAFGIRTVASTSGEVGAHRLSLALLSGALLVGTLLAPWLTPTGGSVAVAHLVLAGVVVSAGGLTATDRVAHAVGTGARTGPPFYRVVWWVFYLEYASVAALVLAGSKSSL